MIVNWSRCAMNLRQHGMPLAQVDKRIGEWKGFAAKLANGDIQEPKFSQGLKLLDLHHDLCGAEKTAALRG